MKKQNTALATIGCLALLFGCQNGTKDQTYILYYGNMITSSIRLRYDAITDKTIQCENTDIPNSYHANFYVLSDAKSIQTFFATSGLTIDAGEKSSLSVPSKNTMTIIAIAQIPSGYTPFKRNNVQKTLKDGTVQMITDNFYSYTYRPTLSFLEFDIRKDDASTAASVFSVVYSVSSSYKSDLIATSIRPFFAVSV